MVNIAVQAICFNRIYSEFLCFCLEKLSGTRVVLLYCFVVSPGIFFVRSAEETPTHSCSSSSGTQVQLSALCFQLLSFHFPCSSLFSFVLSTKNKKRRFTQHNTFAEATARDSYKQFELEFQRVEWKSKQCVSVLV